MSTSQPHRHYSSKDAAVQARLVKAEARLAKMKQTLLALQKRKKKLIKSISKMEALLRAHGLEP